MSDVSGRVHIVPVVRDLPDETPVRAYLNDTADVVVITGIKWCSCASF